ncbi:MAG: nucleoside 2-deoxyribosyltransferase [Brevinematia bacterium]
MKRGFKVYLAVPIVNYYNSEVTKILGEIILDLGFELSSPWVLSGKDVGISPRDIFYRDTNGVRSSDIILAEVSFPSHGVGMEIMFAYLEGKKIILVAKNEVKLSSLLEGIPGTVIIRYKDYEDLKCKVREILNKFFKDS